MALTQTVPGIWVLYTDTTTLTTLGITEEGMSYNAGDEVRPETVDEWGSTPVDYVYVGSEFTIKAKFCEYVNEVMQKVLPWGTSTATMTDIGRRPGLTGSTKQFSLTARPLVDQLAGNTDHDIIMWRAIGGMEAVEGEFTRDNKAIVEGTFKGMLDPNYGSLGRIYSPARI